MFALKTLANRLGIRLFVVFACAFLILPSPSRAAKKSCRTAMTSLDEPRLVRIAETAGQVMNPSPSTFVSAASIESLREFCKRPLKPKKNLLLLPPSRQHKLLKKEFERAYKDLETFLAKLGLRIHISLSHSVEDVLAQVSILIGGFDIKAADAYSVSKIVLLLHFVDDLVETWNWSHEDIHSSLDPIHYLDKKIPPAVSSAIDQVMQNLRNPLLNIGLGARSPESEIMSQITHRQGILNSAIERMLMGLNLFQPAENSEMATRSWEAHRSYLKNRLPDKSEIRDILNRLDPLFVAFSVNSLSEALHISLPVNFALPYSTYEESIFLALILGPIFHGHNEDAEIALAENREEYRVRNLNLEKNLEILSARFHTLRPQHQKEIQIILERALYSMGKVLGPETVSQYKKYFNLQ